MGDTLLIRIFFVSLKGVLTAQNTLEGLIRSERVCQWWHGQDEPVVRR